LTQANKPLLDTTGIGNYYALEFDGSNDALSMAEDVIGVGAVTVFAVVRARGWGGGDLGRFFDNSKFGFQVNASGRLNAFNGTDVYSADSSFSLNTNYVLAITCDTDALTNFYINAQLSGTANQDSGTRQAGTSTYLGNRAAGNRAFNGFIGEIIIIKRILSLPEIQFVSRYLGLKYGVAI